MKQKKFIGHKHKYIISFKTLMACMSQAPRVSIMHYEARETNKIIN